jgi:hypothetical protein
MRRLFFSLILISCWLPCAAQAQASLYSSRLELQLQRQILSGIILPDSHAAVSTAGGTSLNSGSLLRDGALASHFTLSARPLHFYGLERYKLSTFDCALQGVDRGLTTGLFLGALGTSTGMFDENSAWYIAGALTALGAYLGLKSSATDPQFRIRYRWEEE